MSTSPSKPLTPQMQGEVDSIVFKQKRGSPKTGLSPHTTPQPERSAGQGGVSHHLSECRRFPHRQMHQ